MECPFVRISRDEFERFLQGRATMWDVTADQGFLEFVAVRPLTSHDLIDAITSYAPSDEFVYVFPDQSRPLGAPTEGSVQGIPTVDANSLESYIVHTGPEKDGLYFACTIQQAKQGSSFTLLTAERKGAQEQQPAVPTGDVTTHGKWKRLAVLLGRPVEDIEWLVRSVDAVTRHEAIAAASDDGVAEELLGLAIVCEAATGEQITAVKRGEVVRHVPDGEIPDHNMLRWNLARTTGEGGRLDDPPAQEEREALWYFIVAGNAVAVARWLERQGYRAEAEGPVKCRVCPVDHLAPDPYYALEQRELLEERRL